MRVLRSLDPTAVLVVLGLASAAAYAAVVYLFPLSLASTAAQAYDLEQYSRGRAWAAGVYVAGLVVVFGAWAAAFWAAPRVRRPLPIILGFGLLFGTILLWIYPVTAIDIFYYVLQGRMQALYGLNPMAVPASQAVLDPLLPFVGEWTNVPTAYGPLWNAITAAVVGLGFGDVVGGPLAFKVLMLLTYAGCLGLILWGTNRNIRALLLFAWNPLVLLQGPAHAHNDLLMVAMAMLGLVLWKQRRLWALAMVLLALAGSIKLPALLLAPLLLADILRGERSPLRRLGITAASALLGVGAMLAAYLPYWPPWQNFGGLQEMFATQRTFTILSLVRQTLTWLGAPPPFDFEVPRLIGLGIFLLGFVVLLVRIWRGRTGLYTAAFWVFFLYLLTSTTFRIWYPLWAIPWAALAHAELRDELQLVRMRWRAGLLSLTSELSVLMFVLLWRWVLNGTVLPKADWFVMHLLTIPWQFGLPLLVPLLIRRRPAG